MKPIVEMDGICKQFPGVLANDNVSLSVQPQSVHALIGENGAGKSTLMNILCGLEAPDAGSILLHGQPVIIPSPYRAIELGIGMVHQHFMLVSELTVLENIVLGAHMDSRLGLTNYKKARQEVLALLETYRFALELDKKVYDLSAGEMQRVELIKMLYRGAELLILDEPTAVLTPQETLQLFAMMENLVSMGKTVLFITHKLKEVLTISHRITVMRGGKVTGQIETADANQRLLASMMVGRDVVLQVQKDSPQVTQPVARLENVCAENDRGLPAVKDVSFQVRGGEIVGIAGVDGNGQNELAEVLTGLRPATGRLYLHRENILGKSCLYCRRAGISHIPGDRMVFGINGACSIYDNLILASYSHPDYCRYGWMNRPKLSAYADRLVEAYGIAAANAGVPVGTLSGGNMQKVVVAREISQNPDLLLAVQPTRGVDVGAIEFIHKQIIGLRDQGKAVLLISVELDEVLSLSDRVLVMYEGEIVAEFDSADLDELEIGLYMTGAKRMEKNNEK